MVHYKSPTDTMWIIGRIYSNGTQKDLDEVHALQDQMTLVPLASYGKPYTPTVHKVDPDLDMKTPVRERIEKMSARDFFGTLAMAMLKNPPQPADAPIVKQMAKIGVVAGKPVDEDKLAPVMAKWDQVPAIRTYVKKPTPEDNGWEVPRMTGNYGTDYVQRAIVAAYALGANRPEDAVYPVSMIDVDGREYDRSHKYVMHIPKGQMPPVRGFWSLTMYDSDFYLTKNKIDRYSVSQRDRFHQNKDGSVDLYIQKDDPGKEKTANWLPAPSGRFALMMRLYWPNERNPTILNGTWKPAGVRLTD
jgi:hypothetical protein